MELRKTMVTAGAVVAGFGMAEQANAAPVAPANFNISPLVEAAPQHPTAAVNELGRMATTSNAQDPEMVKFCVEEAAGVSSEAGLNKLNPTQVMGSGYAPNSRINFRYGVAANAVSPECEPIIHTRTFTAQQYYKGKANSPKVVFSSLEAMDASQTQQVRLQKPFTGIKGPAVRGYRDKGSLEITYTGADGSMQAFRAAGSRVVRGETDGV